MKFKYIGQDDCFCMELLAYKLVSKDEYLKHGQIIEVPDDLDRVINSMEVDGNFQRVNEKKVAKKEKK